MFLAFKNGVESIQTAGYNDVKWKRWIPSVETTWFICIYLNRGQPLNSAVLYFCQLPSFQIIRALSNFRTYCFSALLNPTWVDLSLHICTQRVEIIFDCFKMLKTITDTVLDWTNHLLSIFHFRYWSRL